MKSLLMISSSVSFRKVCATLTDRALSEFVSELAQLSTIAAVLRKNIIKVLPFERQTCLYNLSTYSRENSL